MGWFSRRREERAAISGFQAPADWMFDGFGAIRSKSGQSVTVKKAVGLAPVWAAVSIISEQVGALPLNVYRLSDDDRTEARSHRMWSRLHDKPNDVTPADRFWSTCTAQLCLYGNAYLLKQRDNLGLVDQLWLLNPAQVQVYWDGERFIKTFRWTPQDGQQREFGPDEVIHVFGLSLDGVIGESVISRCRNAFGAALSRDEFEGGFYERGANLSGVIEHPGKLGDEAHGRLSATWDISHGGSAKAHKTPLLEEGATFKQTSSPLRDLQFVEAQQLSRTDIAVMFKLPPNYLGGSSGDSLTYSTVEDNQIQFALHAINPWTNTIAKALSTDVGVFPQNDVFEAEFDLKGMLRGDAKTRAEYYKTMSDIQAMSRNEIRGEEGLSSIPGGDFPEPTETIRISETVQDPNAPPPLPKPSGPIPSNGNGGPPPAVTNQAG